MRLQGKNGLALLGMAVAIFASFVSSVAEACPFCPPQSQSLTQEIHTMDVAAIVKLVERPGEEAKGEDLGRAKFVIVKLLHGAVAKVGDKVHAVYFGDEPLGSTFLLMGVDPPQIAWSTPMKLSDRAVDYLEGALKQPEGAARLEYFQNYLEDKEPLLAQDAYDEFAQAPYPDIQALKPKMQRSKLLGWIQGEVPANRRRLYLTMLGVCGTQDDVPTLVAMLQSKERSARAGLDALIACYITLKGADALPLIEKLFLTDEQAEYADTYAAIMALRFHGTEGGVISKQAVAKSLARMLDRPALADLVVPDLARMEDWSHMDRLVELFRAADEKSNWVKVPVVRYLRACPKPKAKEYLKQLEKLDPETFESANLFFPFAADRSNSQDSKDAKDGSTNPSSPASAEEEGA